MESFLTFAGFIGCTIAVAIAIIKAIEAVWFFKEFRDKTTKSLDRIEKTLRDPKP
jgi:capsular polysaccharide biosynthesis protein